MLLVGGRRASPRGLGRLRPQRADLDPADDVCPSTTDVASMTSKNFGDLLNAKSITWGGGR
jgi:hypothetical protein